MTHDKRNKRAPVKRAAMSSRLSLLSGITASSSGSSGSGSTITQESISRPRVRKAKGTANQKGRRQRPVDNSVSAKGRTSPREDKGAIDVFAFLEKDQSHASLVDSRNEGGPASRKDGPGSSPHDDSDPDSDPRSFHSDSGISINDTGSDRDSSKMNESYGGGLGTVQEEHVQSHDHASPAEQGHRAELQPTLQDFAEEPPEWYYWAGSARNNVGIPAAYDISAATVHMDEQKPSGYDLLASCLSSSPDLPADSLPPLYRRFGRLNHRILLQLQDEIAEMEEDLQHLDRADAFQRTVGQGRAAPASRRLDWQWGGRELHAKRLELLGRIYVKVEQYNQALASFQRVASTTSPALAKDIERYRQWMEEHKPVAAAETTYLDKENDLLSLVPQPSDSNSESSTPTETTFLPMAVISATALPILLFRIIPSFTSRISVILLLLPSVAFMPQPPNSVLLIDGTNSRHFLCLYFGVLTLAALII